MNVAMLGSDFAPYGRYALMPSYVNGYKPRRTGLSGALMDQLQETGFRTTAEQTKEKELGEMSKSEKAYFFKDLLSKGADVAISVLNEKQAKSSKAAEVARLDTAKALIAAGKGDELTKEKEETNFTPFIIAGGIGIALIAVVAMQRRRSRRR